MTMRPSPSGAKLRPQHLPPLRMQHLRGLFSFTAVVLVALFFCGAGSIRVKAQTSYGSVLGTITDSTGANVIGAKVTLKNIGTNAKVEMTSGAGTYSFINLNPGSYSVTVSRDGFQSYTQNQVDVQIGGATRVDVTLQVGNVTRQ